MKLFAFLHAFQHHSVRTLPLISLAALGEPYIRTVRLISCVLSSAGIRCSTCVSSPNSIDISHCQLSRRSNGHAQHLFIHRDAQRRRGSPLTNYPHLFRPIPTHPPPPTPHAQPDVFSGVIDDKVDDASYEATGAGISSPSAGKSAPMSHPAVNGTSKYQELTTSSGALANGTAVVDKDDCGELGGELGGDDNGGARRIGRSSSGGSYELSATDDQMGGEGQDGGVPGQEEEEEQAGVFGRDGLLAIPNVKTVLILGCAVQVRAEGC